MAAAGEVRRHRCEKGSRMIEVGAGGLSTAPQKELTSENPKRSEPDEDVDAIGKRLQRHFCAVAERWSGTEIVVNWSEMR